MSKANLNVGVNGFGRFGLHLLKYWLDRSKDSSFVIKYINDDTLSLEDVYRIIVNDRYVHFNKYKIQAMDNSLIILEPNGTRHVIEYSNKNQFDIPWLGKPDMILECSGKNQEAKNNQFYLTENVKRVIISATSWDADQTLVFGLNNAELKDSAKVISYGSCTVNAYVPLASFMHKRYGIMDSDVNVIHNIQEYRLDANRTLNRKFCTLEKSAPILLDFLDSHNFVVNYTVVPYTGASMIDFRFRLREMIDKETLISDLEDSFSNGGLKHLYDFDETDIGPEVYNCTTYSTVFIKDQVKVLGDQVYLQGYFDTENSVNRYFDLVDYVSSQMTSALQSGDDRQKGKTAGN